LHPENACMSGTEEGFSGALQNRFQPALTRTKIIKF
jgi:hypothetical protein